MTIQDGVYKCVEQLLEDTKDSGWKTLPLASGVITYGTTQTPKYRRIGDVVYLQGAVKGITTLAKVIGTLPEGYRPTKSMSYAQNTSMQDSHPHFARIQIQTSGEIEIQASTNDISATTWFPIDTSFCI